MWFIFMAGPENTLFRPGLYLSENDLWLEEHHKGEVFVDIVICLPLCSQLVFIGRRVRSCDFQAIWVFDGDSELQW